MAIHVDYSCFLKLFSIWRVPLFHFLPPPELPYSPFLFTSSCKIGLKGCKWSSLNAPGNQTSLSHHFEANLHCVHVSFSPSSVRRESEIRIPSSSTSAWDAMSLYRDLSNVRSVSRKYLLWFTQPNMRVMRSTLYFAHDMPGNWWKGVDSVKLWRETERGKTMGKCIHWARATGGRDGDWDFWMEKFSQPAPTCFFFRQQDLNINVCFVLIWRSLPFFLRI